MRQNVLLIFLGSLHVSIVLHIESMPSSSTRMGSNSCSDIHFPHKTIAMHVRRRGPVDSMFALKLEDPWFNPDLKHEIFLKN